MDPDDSLETQKCREQMESIHKHLKRQSETIKSQARTIGRLNNESARLLQELVKAQKPLVRPETHGRILEAIRHLKGIQSDLGPFRGKETPQWQQLADQGQVTSAAHAYADDFQCPFGMAAEAITRYLKAK